MNAPQERTSLAEPKIALVPVDSLAPSQTQVQQLRRKRFNPDRITEIATSMVKLGQMQAIVVRERPPVMIDGRKYEIVIGERRWLAAQQAGMKLIEAKISQLNDAEALEAQLIENLQREDLHPLEEAEGYRELMAAGNLRKEDLGDRIGKSRSWVYSRLQLLDLLPAARDALEAGRIDVSRALVLAVIGDPVHQAKGLELALERNWTGKDYQYSVRALKEKLDERGFTVSLKTAPFDTADAGLTLKAGRKSPAEPLPACTGCAFRSGNHDPQAADPDVCTNRSCFEKKVRAHGQRVIAIAQTENRTILTGDEAKKIAPYSAGSMNKHHLVGHVDLDAPCDFDEFKEPEPEVAEGIDESDDPAYQAWMNREEDFRPRTYRQLLAGHTHDTVLLDAGKDKVREIVPFKQARAILAEHHDIKLPAHIAAAPAKSSSQPRYDYEAERKKQEELQRARQERDEKERARRVAIWEAIDHHGKLPKVLQKEHLIWAASAVCGDWDTAHGFKTMYGHDMRGRKDAMKESQLRDLLLLAPVAAELGDMNRPSKALMALAKACRIDVNKVLREHAEESKPKPDKKRK